MTTPRLQTIDSAALPYLLSIPGRAEGSTPVLFFLHGYDEAAPMEMREALTRHGPLRVGHPPEIRDEFIIVAPQLPLGGDIWHRHADAIEEILLGIHAEHQGDPERTFLSGFSYGGNGVVDLGALKPERWKALWAVDPTRVPGVDLEQPVWLSAGEVARRREASFVQELRLGHPRADGYRDRVYVDEGEDHVGSARLAFADERIYQWLLEAGASSRIGAD